MKEDVKPVILINILNYELLEVPEYHTETVTVAKKHREYEISRDITYHFIELPKFRRQKPELANALECWLALIDYKNKELVKMAEDKEKIIKEAKEDFEFAKDGYAKGIYTKRWGPNVDSQVCGHGIIAAIELYKCTLDSYYIDIAASYAKIVLSCQQSTDPNWDIPLKGFFYEDPKHEWMLTYEHRGHEQSPVQGLCMLCEVAPNHPDYEAWINGLKLYREYVEKYKIINITILKTLKLI